MDFDMAKGSVCYSTYLPTEEMKKWLENNKSCSFVKSTVYTVQDILYKDKNTDCIGKLICTGKGNFDKLKNCLSPIFTVYPNF